MADFKTKYTALIADLKTERAPIDEKIKGLQAQKGVYDNQIKLLEGMIKQMDNPTATTKRRAPNKPKAETTPK